MLKRMREWSLLSLARAVACGLFFLMPILYLPWTVEPTEVIKQTVLLIGVGVIWLCLLSDWAQKKRIQINWHPLMWLLLLPLAAAFLSACLSESLYLSWIGSPQVLHGSVLTLFGMTLFAASLPTLFEQINQRLLFACVLFGSVIAVSIGLIMGISTAGSPVQLALLAIVVSTLAITYWCMDTDHHPLLHRGWLGALEQLIVVLFVGATAFTFLRVDVWLLWLLWLVGLVAVVLVSLTRAPQKEHRNHVILPIGLIIVAIAGLLGVGGMVSQQTQPEIALGMKASWQFIEEAPRRFIGTGPGTFAHTVAALRPVELNTTPFWQSRFDQAASIGLTLPITVGIIGTLCWMLALCSGIGAKAVRWRVFFPSWMVLLLSWGLFPMNILLVFLLFGVLGWLFVGARSESTKITFRNHPLCSWLVPGLLGLAAIVLCMVMFFQTGRLVSQVMLAQVAERDRLGASPAELVEGLQSATAWNQFDDVLYRNLAIASIQSLSEQLTEDASVEQIQTQAAIGVTAAQRAVSIDPANALNWLVQARVWRQLIPVEAQAAQTAITSLKQARVREPNNPLYLTELAKTYTVIGDDESLEHASSLLFEAIELKPDYAPAHYQLGLVLEAQGQLDTAIGKMTSIVQQYPMDVTPRITLGTYLLKRAGEGDLNFAQEQFEQVLELVPSYVNIHWLLASVFELKGDRTSALRAVERIEVLSPGNPLVRERLDRLYRGDLITSFSQIDQPTF